MNKKYILAGVLVVGIIVVISTISLREKKDISQNTNSDFTASTTLSTPVVSTSSVVIKKEILEKDAYKDISGKFSITLPKDWAVLDTIRATTTTYVWFHNPSGLKDITNMKIVIERFARDDKANALIEKMGVDAFQERLIDTVKLSSHNYNLVSEGYKKIDGKTFREVIGKYIGMKTQKEVIQYVYVTTTKDSYYLIASDVYSQMWDTQKEAILQSLNSLKILE